MNEAQVHSSGSSAATFYPVLACNAKCPFCSTRVYTDQGIVSSEDYNRPDRDPNSRLRVVSDYSVSLDQAKEIYRKLRDDGVGTIHIQGGEPTVYEPLAELIVYGREIGIREQILVTNGRMFKDPAYAAKIVAARPSTIAFSIYGANKKVHDESLGVIGCFDDMLAGVRNVVEQTEAARKDGGQRIQVTGQIILHSRNYRTLPDIFRFWQEQGIRSFGFRLLRETFNTKKESDAWFFDLAKLKEPLEQALDHFVTLGDIELTFSEIFGCLLDPSYIGFVLSELQSSQRLWKSKVIANKHTKEVTSYVASRSVIRDRENDPCDACDLRQSCVKIEQTYQPYFTGARCTVRVAEAVKAIAAVEVDAKSYRRVRRLLSCEEALDAFEIPEEDRIALHKRLIAFGDTGDLGGLPSPVHVRMRSQHRIDVLRDERKKRTPIFLKVSEFGENKLFRGDGKAILADLVGRNEAPLRDKLTFLESTDCLLVEPMFVVFAGRLDRGPKRPSIPFLAILYNDYCVTEAHIEKFLDAGPSKREPREQGASHG
jgi:MoaA/NifB/PqqE/SkfB family radical SAM enzyme